MVICIIMHHPAFGAGFVLDDAEMLTAERPIKTESTLWQIWFGRRSSDYFSLTSNSLWLERRIWGMNATGYHVTNVLLHGYGAILLWRVVRHPGIPGH